MSKHPSRSVPHGFTLIETLLALFIISILFSSIMKGIAIQSKSLEHLRNKTMATWVATNEMNQTFLDKTTLQPGRSRGTGEQGDQTWYFLKKITPSQFPGVLRIEIEVSAKENEAVISQLEFFKAASEKN